MTHPTIEAAGEAIGVAAGEARIGITTAQYHTHLACAAARVILSAPPSEVEIEAAWAAIRTHKERDANAVLRAAITAARAKCLEELEGK